MPCQASLRPILILTLVRCQTDIKYKHTGGADSTCLPLSSSGSGQTQKAPHGIQPHPPL